MKYLSFNAQKSLKNKRLVFDEPLILKGFDTFYYFFLLAFPVIFSSAFVLIQWYKRHPLWLPVSIICFCFSLYYGGFIFFQLRKSRYFRKVIRPNKRRENISWMNEICRRRHWKILKNDNHCQVIMVENFKMGSTQTGKELFLLYHDNIVYLRLLTYSNFDRINPFHWKSQRRLEDKVIALL